MFFKEFIRSTDKFRLILLLHNVQIIKKKKKDIHADVTKWYFQFVLTFNIVVRFVVLPNTFHIWGGNDPLAFK